MLKTFARQIKYFLSTDNSTNLFVKYFCGLFDNHEAPVGVEIPYARHHNPRFIYLLPHFCIEVRFILQTTHGLKMEILHFLSLKSAVFT